MFVKVTDALLISHGEKTVLPWMDGVIACHAIPHTKRQQFSPRLGHTSRWWVGFLSRACTGSNQWMFLTSMFLSPLLLSVKPINIALGED